MGAAFEEENMTTMADPVNESDAALVAKALEGDADAFAILFNRHKHRVYAVCLRMTNNTAEADDLTQEVFLQVFRKLNTFRGESALSTWLYRLAVNSALMHFRRQGPHHISIDDPGENEGVPAPRREFGRADERLTFSLERIALTRALNGLPRGYRAIFELHEIKGYGHREIAKLLNCSIGNSKSQLHKAKQRIRECLFPKRRRASLSPSLDTHDMAWNQVTPNQIVNHNEVALSVTESRAEFHAESCSDNPPLMGRLPSGLAETTA